MAYEIVENVGEGPCHCGAQEGQAEQDQMHSECKDDVGEPDAFAIQPC